MWSFATPSFQWERPCKNLGEVCSLVHELNIASASKRNFVIGRLLTKMAVRLRRTCQSSAVHQASWAFDPLAWCFPFEIGHSARSASSRHDQAPFWKTAANNLIWNTLKGNAQFLPDTLMYLFNPSDYLLGGREKNWGCSAAGHASSISFYSIEV